MPNLPAIFSDLLPWLPYFRGIACTTEKWGIFRLITLVFIYIDHIGSLILTPNKAAKLLA
ncbi:hypothetical protein BAE46_13000 [Glaciecola punicea]|jgi:hypothetical protein|nr:hypothetical protein BAE46_13000 [Glaciecola punicea]